MLDIERNARNNISIHALRKECDMGKKGMQDLIRYISIHALRKECDLLRRLKTHGTRYFYPRTP